MRLDWVSASAAALITGVFALMLGYLLNPLSQERAVSESVRAAGQTGQWMTSAVALFIASVGMTLGLPALLSLVVRRYRRLGLLAFTVLAVGTIGLSGYGFMTAFLGGMLRQDMLHVDRMDRLAQGTGLQVFLGVWVGCFLVGVALFGLGMLRASTAPRWVPVLLLLFVVSELVPEVGGRTVTMVQLMVLAVGLTGASLAAHDDALVREDARSR